MSFSNHQAPVNSREFWVDAPRSIGGEIERPLYPVVAGLRDGLSGPIYAPRRICTWIHPAKSPQLVQASEPAHVMQHAKHKWPESNADTGN
jgi:hypothetical protein